MKKKLLKKKKLVKKIVKKVTKKNKKTKKASKFINLLSRSFCCKEDKNLLDEFLIKIWNPYDMQSMRSEGDGIYFTLKPGVCVNHPWVK